MSYPGNQALTPEVQKRISSTFEHTLGLAADGSRQEALLGCDFVLRMDPDYKPAQQLQERLGASMGAVPVDDLRAAMRSAAAAAVAAAAAPGPARQPTPQRGATGSFSAAETAVWHDLDGLSLPELPDLHPTGLGAQLEALLSQRKFQDVAAHAAANQAAVAADPSLQRLVETAHERLEAGPYVVRFLAAAREAQARNDHPEADRLIEKARSLDPSHPGVAELSAPGVEHSQPAFQVVDEPTAGVDLSPLRTMAIPMQRLQAASGGDAESERRIQQLLDEGDAAQAGGDPQAAIDAWSRIFLIDIDHAEAARRIELARRVKAETERQVEEIYHDGLGCMERGDAAGAKEAFEKVLAIQPGHLGAREYLQQVETQQPAALRDAGKRALGRATPPPPTAAVASAPRPAAMAPPQQSHPGGELQEEILVPPDLGEMPARSEPRREARTGAAEGRGKRLFVVVGSAVLLLLVAVGWFVYPKREQWFPNSQTEEAPPALANDPLTRAKHLHDTGKVAAGLSQLRRLPPSDPHYKEAQALIAKWEPANAPLAQAAPSLAPVPAAAPPPSATELHRTELLEQAQKAYAGHAYFRASERYDQADRIAHLEANDAATYSDAQQHVVPIAKQISMFHQHDWEYALPELWKLHQADPQNQDIRELMVDCYFDLGVRDLQRMDTRTAVEKFQEGAKLDPDDKGLEHELLFARTYLERAPDLLFRIYVKYLPLR